MATPNPRAPTPASLPIYNKPQMQSANARVLASDCTGVGAEAQMSLRRSSSSASPLPPNSERETLLTPVCGYPLQTIYRGQAALLGAGLCRRPLRMG